MSFPFILVVPQLKVDGMALFPFILVRDASFKKDKVLIRHETIHLYQELELLIVPFYLLYLINYLVNRLVYKQHFAAYLNIIFEREAYVNENNDSYLKQRKFWGWLKYLGNNR